MSKSMLQKRIDAIRAESDDDEEFVENLAAMFDELGDEVGEAMVKYADECPAHALGHFFMCVALGAAAATRGHTHDETAESPAPAPPKQATLALVPAVPEDCHITPEQMKLWRRERKLTQREVGAMVGLSAATISRWELGTFEPTLRQLATMKSALKPS